MTSLRYLLSGMFSKHSNLIKHLYLKVNHCYAYFHTSEKILGINLIEVKMPSLSPTMTEGTIVKWLKKEGDPISPGDCLCEIQTDKAVVGLETEEEGILTKIRVPENSPTIQLGEVIALISGEGSTEENLTTDMHKSVEVTELSKHKEGSSIFGPSVRKLLEEYGLIYSEIPCSGPHGVILKGDVLNVISSKKLKQKLRLVEKPMAQVEKDKVIKTEFYVDIPLTVSEKNTAAQVLSAKNTIPHAYMSADCKIDKVFYYQKQMKVDGIDVSLTDFVVKSAATALRNMPQINVLNHNGHVKALESVNIMLSIAGVEASILKNVDCLSIQDISEEVKSSSLQIKKENVGSNNCSLRISNLGVLGISEFCELIQPPEVALLAVGAERYVVEDGIPTHKVTVTLSFDMTVMTDYEAGNFLSYFRNYLENPLQVSS